MDIAVKGADAEHEEAVDVEELEQRCVVQLATAQQLVESRAVGVFGDQDVLARKLLVDMPELETGKIEAVLAGFVDGFQLACSGSFVAQVEFAERHLLNLPEQAHGIGHAAQSGIKEDGELEKPAHIGGVAAEGFGVVLFYDFDGNLFACLEDGAMDLADGCRGKGLRIEGGEVVEELVAGVGADERNGILRRKARSVAVEACEDAAALVVKKIGTQRIDLADLYGEQTKTLNVLDIRFAACIDCVQEPEETEDVHLAGRLQFRSRTGAIVFVVERIQC